VSQRSDVHEFFEQLAVTVATTLVEAGIEDELAETAGWNAADHIKAEWGGGSLYIPKGTWQEVYAVHREIYNRWNKGEEPKDLAREYGRTVPATNLIIRQMRKKMKSLQPTLFDGLAQTERQVPTIGEA
jgi:Mor family transcriptional regulator